MFGNKEDALAPSLRQSGTSSELSVETTAIKQANKNSVDSKNAGALSAPKIPESELEGVELPAPRDIHAP